MIRVTIQLPSGTTQVHEFEKASVMLGRAAANDICLDHGGISRYHATVSYESGSLVIQDLGSTNGTLVGGKKIQTTQISSGERIILGDIPVVIEYSEAASIVDAAAPENVTGTVVPGTMDIPPSTGQGFVLSNDDIKYSVKSKRPTISNGLNFPSSDVDGSPRVPTVQSLENVSPLPIVEPAEPKIEKPAEEKQEPTNVPSTVSKQSENNAFFWQAMESFLAPIWKYIVDDKISEIMVNGPTEIYIEQKGKLEKISAVFTPEQLQAAVLNIAQYVGRRVSEEEPYLDARLPDGSRVAVLLPPCSRKGTSLAIRKFSKEKLTIERLMDFGSLSKEMVAYLQAAVILKKNTIISGGTSSGKTSLLNVVSSLIPIDERIITIEDSAELQLSQDHVLPMETKPADKKGRGQVTIRDLVKASLRMRPDRIVVGEIRGGEALDLLQAMNTGHSGSMATVHASSPQQALTRLETLSLFSGIEIPLRALREQVSTAIEVIVQASRLPDHSRKVTHISEVCKLTEGGEYQVKDIFRFARTGSENGKIIGKHVWTGEKSNMLSEMELCGLSEAMAIFSGKPPEAGVVYQAAGH